MSHNTVPTCREDHSNMQHSNMTRYTKEGVESLRTLPYILSGRAVTIRQIGILRIACKMFIAVLQYRCGYY